MGVFDSSELTAVRERLDSLGERIDEMVSLMGRVDAAMDALREAGMYENAPARESWESRGKDKPPAYLYLYFGMDQSKPGKVFLGPDGKRKLYVGSDPGRIAEARRMVENQERYHLLQIRRQQIVFWFMAAKRDLDGWDREAARRVSAGGALITDNRELPDAAALGPILVGAHEEAQERIEGVSDG